jgi:uncharacterized protein (DUF1697 family)
VLSVAFFRNLNQGQRNSPSTSQLIAAFEGIGARSVVPFQSNGTVVFDAPDPQECTNAAVERLAADSRWDDVAFVRDRDWLAALLATQPTGEPESGRTELSLFDPTCSLAGGLPLRGTRCTVVSYGPGFAITVNERDRESNATATLERALGTPVTSRGMPTLSRLVERLARLEA